jgi:hypothetical protein
MIRLRDQSFRNKSKLKKLLKNLVVLTLVFMSIFYLKGL